MEALQTVFDTILKVFEIIKDFFAALFPQEDPAEGDATDPEA